MQFLVYFTMKPGESMTPPTEENMAKMGTFMMESFQKGIIVSTGQLREQPTLVTLKGEQMSITDGPFTESNEIIPGYTLIEVPTKDEAIQWTKDLRLCMGEGTLRMAPIYLPSMEPGSK